MKKHIEKVHKLVSHVKKHTHVALGHVKTHATKAAKNKKIVFGGLGGVVLVIALMAIYLVSHSSLVTAQDAYSLKLTSGKPTDGFYAKNKKVIADLQIANASTHGLLSFHKTVPVNLTVTLDKKTVFNKSYMLDQNRKNIKQSIPLDLTMYGEGAYPVEFILTDSATKKQYGKINASVLLDTTAPEVAKISTKTGTAYKFDMTSDKNSSPAAKLGINLYTNSKDAQIVDFALSEKASINVDVPKDTADVTVAFPASNSAQLSINSKKSDWKAPFTVTDPAGNSVNGEIHFVMDTTAPTFTISNDIWPLGAPLFNLFFSASEPMAYVKVMSQGVTKYASGDYAHLIAHDVPLVEGDNTISVEGADLAGNHGSQTVTIKNNKPQRISLPDFFNKPVCTDEEINKCKEGHDMTSCSGLNEFKSCVENKCRNRVNVTCETEEGP